MYEVNSCPNNMLNCCCFPAIQNPGQLGVAIESDRLNVVYGRSWSWQSRQLGRNITDGFWHHFKIAIKNSEIMLSVDGVTTSITVSSIKHIGQRLYFGAISPSFFDLSLQLIGTSFTGCLRDVFVNSTQVNLTSGQRVHTSPLPRPGCLQDSLCAQSVCQNRGTCRSTWNGPVCQCSASYYGDRCQNGRSMSYFHVILKVRRKLKL